MLLHKSLVSRRNLSRRKALAKNRLHPSYFIPRQPPESTSKIKHERYNNNRGYGLRPAGNCCDQRIDCEWQHLDTHSCVRWACKRLVFHKQQTLANDVIFECGRSYPACSASICNNQRKTRTWKPIHRLTLA